ncbi:hypothetical protein DFH09DRAFT_1111299 [Mycena vulgaris]|nr:hypothetical protein DFH09DRAFT_1111299 [Mycena vulgaris]
MSLCIPLSFQENAEEFLGFFPDPLEEEFLALAPAVVEAEEPPEAQDGWLEVGRKNRAIVTRTDFSLIHSFVKEAELPISRIFGGKWGSFLLLPSLIAHLRAGRNPHDARCALVHRAPASRANGRRGREPADPHPGAAARAGAARQALLLGATAGDIKLTKRVAFGPELKIWGAVYQRGVSAAGGHYTLDVSHVARGWVGIDDDLVSDVRAEDEFKVEREREEGRYSVWLLSVCAYRGF